MRWSRQYAFKMLIFQSILTGGDMFGYSLSITCGDCVPFEQSKTGYESQDRCGSGRLLSYQGC